MIVDRVLPWWMSLFLAPLFGFMAAVFWWNDLEDRDNLATVIANTPEIVELENLLLQNFDSPMLEFAVRDFAVTSVGLYRGRSSRKGSFLGLESTSVPPVYLAFTDIYAAEDRFTEIAEAIQADLEGYVIRGVLRYTTLDRGRAGDNVDRGDVTDVLVAEGVRLEGRTILMADLLDGEREEAAGPVDPYASSPIQSRDRRW